MLLACRIDCEMALGLMNEELLYLGVSVNGHRFIDRLRSLCVIGIPKVLLQISRRIL